MNVPAPAFQRAWLTVDDYLVLHEQGSLERLGKTELLEGEIVQMAPQHTPHAYAKHHLARRIETALEALGSGLIVLPEVSVDMPPHDMPMPDIVVQRPPLGRKAVALAQVALLVEIAAATLKSDIARKTPLYARHGVPEVWLLDLVGARIVQHWHPTPDGFADRRETPLGEPVTAVTVAGLTVATGGLLV